jgi:Na+/H+ antiporter NhaD/arsenite permease-like protein
MRLRPPAAMPPLRPRVWLTLSVLAGTVAAYTAGADLAWAATGGFAALLVLHRRDAALLWARIDWSILLFFAGLFVVVEGLVRTGLPARVFAALPLLGAAPGLGDLARGAGIFLLGSNVVSNVPFILVVRETMQGLPDPRLGWELLAMASTFAGNLTLLGSVANIIVAERAREIGGIGFWAYFRVGLPLTLLTTAWGVLWLWWVYPGP